jgi:hypothetical protein
MGIFYEQDYLTRMPSVIKHIEQGEDEIEIEVFFDFQPYEAVTHDYPGCDASCDIYEVVIVNTDAEICLLKDIESTIEEEILCEYEEARTGGDPRW